MKPVRFVCQKTLPLAAAQIAAQILEVTTWSGFQGYGPIPGIKLAEFETRTANVVGSRIRVTNLDGSSHVEEIVEWRPESRLRLQMGTFSPPLCRLATHFIETWEFRPAENGTRVSRSFELYASSPPTRPLLWLISFFLKRAIARQLSAIEQTGGAN